jgi:hypothetical protein
MQSWTLWHHLDLKPIIYTPFDDFARGRQRNRNTPCGSEDCEDRRGDAAGGAPGCPFDSIDIISFGNMMKRE